VLFFIYEDILKNVGNSWWTPLTSIVFLEVNGVHQLFGHNIVQNIFVCLQQKKEIHTGLMG